MPDNRIAVGEDWRIEVLGLSTDDGVLINDASLTWSIKDIFSGATVGSGAFVASGSGGNYHAVISDSITSQLREAGHYHIIVSGEASGRTLYRVIEVAAYYRENE